MKINKKSQIIQELQKIPVVQVACEKVGISRQTYYRWIKTSKTFERDCEKAMIMGNDNICDIAETTLLNCLKDEKKDLSAAKFILQSISSKYKNKVEISKVKDDTPLTDKQKEIINKTLTLLKYEN